MSTSKDLREGVATRLHAAGIGTWRPFGKYLATDTAPIHLSRMPSELDRVLVVTVYPLGAYTFGVQVRCRGAKGGNTSAEDLADAVRAELHGITDVTWGETQVDQLTLLNVARMGFDGSDRDEVAVNLRAVTSDPSTALID